MHWNWFTQLDFLLFFFCEFFCVCGFCLFVGFLPCLWCFVFCLFLCLHKNTKNSTNKKVCRVFCVCGDFLYWVWDRLCLWVFGLFAWVAFIMFLCFWCFMCTGFSCIVCRQFFCFGYDGLYLWDFFLVCGVFVFWLVLLLNVFTDTEIWEWHLSCGHNTFQPRKKDFLTKLWGSWGHPEFQHMLTILYIKRKFKTTGLSNEIKLME